MHERSSHDALAREISLVIPAHNEREVLHATLEAVVNQDFDGEIDIVVVANGCTDDTVDVARSFQTSARRRGRSLTVCELAASSKPAALNHGDQEKRFDCTMYLDADVVLSSNAIDRVYHALHGHTPVPIAAPRLEVAPSRSRVTRSYGRVWSRIPYIERRVRGVGCYAVSAPGRSRWQKYPDLMADDRFARLHFRADEQKLVQGASYSWPLPEGARELVRVRARWLLGNDELRRARPDLSRNEDPRYEGLFGFVAIHPWLWPDVLVFVGVYGFALARMALKRRKGDRTWDRAVRARRARLGTTRSAGQS
jgi:glycosyltransferase involved in cell wall biosynthesis